MELKLKRPPMKEGVSRDVTVVWLTGRKVSLDEEAVDRIHDQLFALADEPSESDFLLDFGNVDYVTSTALGTLVSLHKKLRARGRHLTVGNLSPQVYEVFAVTSLDKFLDLRLVGQENEPAARDGQFGSPTRIHLKAEDVETLAVRPATLEAEP
jgi:anti-sigma B factor antagonist